MNEKEIHENKELSVSQKSFILGLNETIRIIEETQEIYFEEFDKKSIVAKIKKEIITDFCASLKNEIESNLNEYIVDMLETNKEEV